MRKVNNKKKKRFMIRSEKDCKTKLQICHDLNYS